MIEAIVHTNLVKHRTLEWPKFVACKPDRGDKVRSMCGKQY